MKNIEQSPFIHILKWAIAISIPVWLVLTGVRLVATDAFLQLEYSKPNFPADYYGFTQEDRLAYAPFAVQYLSNNEDISFLGDLKFPDGTAMYNERELHHMDDVQDVSVIAFRVQVVLTVFLIGTVIFLLHYSMTTRSVLRQALLQGASLTLALIITLMVMAITSWDIFFTQFHRMFFADGTWRFEYSDTLIRLFPEIFWFDAAVTIGIFTTAGAITLLILALMWKRQQTKTAAPQNTDDAAVSNSD